MFRSFLSFPPKLALLLAVVACTMTTLSSTSLAQDDDAPPRGRTCGSATGAPSDVRQWSARLRTQRTLPSVITIDVAWHVIRAEQYGRLDRGRINSQIDVLNRCFRPAGIQFRLASVDETANRAWFRMTPGSREERLAKASLAKSPARVLNVFSAGPRDGSLGWSSLPWRSASAKTQGIVVHHNAVVGGRFERFNLGATLVHEVGHYLGLSHTFENGCDAPGDGIEDTPAEADPAFGCPRGNDTCPSLGADPIHNYMDYSDDACMSEFTPGQFERMRSTIGTLRPGLVASRGAR